MIKPAKKVICVILRTARGTATAMGLAVMLALLIGATTTALAAVPGDPLKLGQRNGMDVLTILVGRANGALLSIENGSPGAKGAPAPALSLKVEAGNPPLTANATAGTATNLSADKLDGMDSAALYPTKTYTIKVREEGQGYPILYVPFGVHCDPGDKLVTGGAGNVGFDQQDALIDSEPHDEGWWALMRDGGDPSTLEVSIRCADRPPLR